MSGAVKVPKPRSGACAESARSRPVGRGCTATARRFRHAGLTQVPLPLPPARRRLVGARRDGGVGRGTGTAAARSCWWRRTGTRTGARRSTEPMPRRCGPSTPCSRSWRLPPAPRRSPLNSNPREYTQGRLISLMAIAWRWPCWSSPVPPPAAATQWLSARSSSSRRTTSARTFPGSSPPSSRQDPRLEMLVVDDGSPDGTGDRSTRSRPRNRASTPAPRGQVGLGTAYLAGFRWALERELRLRVRDGRRLLARPGAPPGVPASDRRTADLVLGSRYRRRRVTVVNWPIPAAPLLLRQRLRALDHRAADLTTRPAASSASAGGARGIDPGPGPVERLRLPDRDELPRLEEGVPDRRDPDRVRGPDEGRARCRSKASWEASVDGLAAPAG